MSERYPAGEWNADVASIAESFARDMKEAGVPLDFTMHSLEVEIDALLERYKDDLAREDSYGWRLTAGLEAYVGETLARLLNGAWKGTFNSVNPGSNMYTSYVEFGAYKYYPSHFLGYRITNGLTQGTFKEHLDRARPRIKGRAEDDELSRI
jgi:hypothetical protein